MYIYALRYTHVRIYTYTHTCTQVHADVCVCVVGGWMDVSRWDLCCQDTEHGLCVPGVGSAL